MKAIILGLALLTGACASNHELADCDGPLRPLNAAHWQPTAQELAVMKQASR